jgi:hypothetical protein
MRKVSTRPLGASDFFILKIIYDTSTNWSWASFMPSFMPSAVGSSLTMDPRNLRKLRNLVYTENKHLLILQIYALIFNLQKKLLNKPKDLLILQMFYQFPNDVINLQRLFVSFTKSFVKFDRTFVKPTNLLVNLTSCFVWWKSMHTFVKSTNVYFQCIEENGYMKHGANWNTRFDFVWKLF